MLFPLFYHCTLLNFRSERNQLNVRGTEKHHWDTTDTVKKKKIITSPLCSFLLVKGSHPAKFQEGQSISLT